jgi:hypothetical protein
MQNARPELFVPKKEEKTCGKFFNEGKFRSHKTGIFLRASDHKTFLLSSHGQITIKILFKTYFSGLGE